MHIGSRSRVFPVHALKRIHHSLVLYFVTKQSSIELKWIDFNLAVGKRVHCCMSRPWCDTTDNDTHRSNFETMSSHCTAHRTHVRPNRKRVRKYCLKRVQTHNISEPTKKNLHNVFQFTRGTDTTASNETTVHQMWQISPLLPIIFPFLFRSTLCFECVSIRIAFSIHLIVAIHLVVDFFFRHFKPKQFRFENVLSRFNLRNLPLPTNRNQWMRANLYGKNAEKKERPIAWRTSAHAVRSECLWFGPKDFLPYWTVCQSLDSMPSIMPMKRIEA